MICNRERNNWKNKFAERCLIVVLLNDTIEKRYKPYKLLKEAKIMLGENNG
jgi:hypothetical protein